MKPVNICIGLSGCLPQTGTQQELEALYQSVYKPMMSSLYSCPDIPFMLHLSGRLLEWFEKHHPELLMLLEEMTERKQLEMLGGGYYEPLFPLIPPADRVGQIEMMTTILRRLTGKRPRGCWLPGSGWDPSLISSLNTCGMEYILLDKDQIACEQYNSREAYSPVIIEEMGKTIYALPMDTELFTGSGAVPQAVLDRLLAVAGNREQSAVCAFVPLQLVPELFSPSGDGESWMEGFFSTVREHPEAANFSLPGRFMKHLIPFRKTYISSGAAPAVTRWSLIPFAAENDAVHPGFLTRSSLRRFLFLYPEALNIYSRMMYTHLLVNQIKGDRIRKKAAREELWKGQYCDAYWFIERGGICDPAVRRQAYRHLIQAEKMARDRNTFLDSVICFDFDTDGFKEYIGQFLSFNIFIHLCGGSVFELDLFSTPHNYADTMDRTVLFDGIGDRWRRKLFVDHLVDCDELALLSPDSSRMPDDTVFSGLLYQEIGFDRIRHEILMKASGFFGPLKQPVTLKKKYMLSRNGIQVQYILKNDSPLPLTGCFAVESNLSLPRHTQQDQIIEVISGDAREEVLPDMAYRRDDGVSYTHVYDSQNNIQFVFEPNEDAGIAISPLVINRPAGDSAGPVYQATNVIFHWKVDLVAGYEMEKTLFFKITSHKNR
ncbi:MAG: DUF1926 domain-containing protein [Spirochaetaceae bacterium]|jgi:hypothetical protein|nr:DUF1926 domain-containing protein [Spirochaetaceae bacterium]